jgi:hypothetical protein
MLHFNEEVDTMTRDTQLDVSDDSIQLVQCDNLDLEAGSKSPFAMLECVRNTKLLQKNTLY